ncbi:hypothetical protein C8R43DRAFT_1229231 [Mycena crocata]|nr:hypothetical protein C8R43DRAFT_1229231 [Mycena crocata]
MYDCPSKCSYSWLAIPLSLRVVLLRLSRALSTTPVLEAGTNGSLHSVRLGPLLDSFSGMQRPQLSLYYPQVIGSIINGANYQLKSDLWWVAFNFRFAWIDLSIRSSLAFITRAFNLRIQVQTGFIMDIPFARKVSNGAIVELRQEIMAPLVQKAFKTADGLLKSLGAQISRKAATLLVINQSRIYCPLSFKLKKARSRPQQGLAFADLIVLGRNYHPNHASFLEFRFSRLESKKAETTFNNATTMAGRFRFNSRAPLQASNTRHFILEELFDTIYPMLRYKIPVEDKLNSHFPPKFFSFLNTTTFDHSVVAFQKASGISAHLRNLEHTTYRVPATGLKAQKKAAGGQPAATLNLPRGNNEDSVVRVAGAGQHFSSDIKPPEANASLDLQGDACLQ